MATEHRFSIEEVADFDAAWPDLEMLSLGIIDYHRPWDERALRADWSERMHGYLEGMQDSLTLIARNDAGAAVAFVTGKVEKDYGIFIESFAFIANFYVVPEARAQGVGSQLLRRFEDWARAEGATELRLHVNAGNELGQRFWEINQLHPIEYVMSKPLVEAGP